MSTAAAVEGAVPGQGGKKKLIIVVVAVLLLLAAVGGGAVFWLKKKAPAAAGGRRGRSRRRGGAGQGRAKHDPKAVPIFVPLDPFTVNLADREAERYAQIGITLELDDAKFGDQIKAFMPAIRNDILMVLAHKSSAELLDRDGKEKLADEILRETVRAAGPGADGAGDAAGHEERRPTTSRARCARCTSPTSSSSDADGGATPASDHESADPLARRSRRAAAGHHRREPEARAGGGAERRPSATTTWPARSASSVGACPRWRSSTSASRATSASACSTSSARAPRSRSAASRCRSTAPSCARSWCRPTSTSSPSGRCAARG